MRRLELIAVEGLPEVRPGDDLSRMISEHAALQAGDVVVVAQKVVSKAEGRLVELSHVKAGDEAVRISARLIAKPDPRMVQVVLDESVRVLRSDRVLITETRHGYVCANSGVDHSNVGGADLVTLLPLDPDASAERLRSGLRELTGAEVGVIVSDTFGRPWRLGIVNVALGLAGLPALLDLRGTNDDAGLPLHATVLAIADDIAASAGLAMGKTARTPAVVVRGLALQGAGSGRDLIRPADEDLFR
ncbi:MAG: coenzyme F420-0:L-glutamate ligase [Chloroflexi bacterium]|nr:MAG: coenzyme F420-0:L-glutamate ligase [Actinobacteria bacterium 13_2_20CM_2_66_6]TMD36521.1 MAG: coenzyme F420-0:L-glutamate ligase [Chloroflexota bacterium]TMD74421.1 MAG: coenzyme F420-0:L-glutamate ligase [Chloroflexota bacterium]